MPGPVDNMGNCGNRDPRLLGDCLHGGTLGFHTHENTILLLKFQYYIDKKQSIRNYAYKEKKQFFCAKFFLDRAEKPWDNWFHE
jgi:hypothetical protein